MRLLLAFALLTSAFCTNAQWSSSYADVDQDGCIGVGDVLEVLSLFGDCSATWQCGDTLEYDNYWYETVLIGNQCWFAENLRTSIFANGDSIPFTSSPSEFSSSNSPLFRAHPALNNIGYYYNFYCVEDGRNLCPSGWTVPNDNQWLELEAYVGVENISGICFRSGGAAAMKASSANSPAWNGTNSSGFKSIPAGYVGQNGGFILQGSRANFWSSSRLGEHAIRRRLDSENDGVNRDLNQCDGITLNLGFSVRCLKTTE